MMLLTLLRLAEEGEACQGSADFFGTSDFV
jgi:hypothetical protein